MPVLCRNANLDTEVRLSRQQRQTIANAAVADPEAELLGLDKKGRPVLKMKAGIPQRKVKFALLRNGDPTDPTGLREAWNTPKPRKALKGTGISPAAGKP